MKILLITNYGYIAGGAEKCVYTLKENLSKRGHEVRVLATDHRDKLIRAKSFSDAEFPEIDKPSRSMLSKIAKHLWYGASYSATKKMIHEFRPDVIHLHTTSQFSPSIFFAFGGVPALLTVHGLEEYTETILEWGLPTSFFANNDPVAKQYTLVGKVHVLYHHYLQRPLYVMGFRRSLKAMIAPSEYMAGVLASEGYKVPVRCIHNGIELPSATKPNNNNKILFVGRLDYVKGAHVLIGAMKKVVQSLPDTHLVIVGDGAARDELERLVIKEKLVNSIEFRGWLSGDAITAAYKDAAVVCVPSLCPENLNTVCIEALAFGRPVVATHVGGTPEIVNDPRLGSTVPAGDPTQLADSLILALKMDKNGLFKKCAESAKRFSLDRYIDEHEQLYKGLTKK